MPERLPTPHLLTCPARAVSLAETLASWRSTDWGGTPQVHLDLEPERAEQPWGSPARAGRLTDAFAGMLREALAASGLIDGWLLFLEDDLEFHPRLGSLLAEWLPLKDEHCVFASIFNPSVQENPAREMVPSAFVARPENFLGAQAILLRRWAAAKALARWNFVPGLTSQRLVRLLGGEGPIWVHRPSLVQHVAVESSWGARIQRALDFDPGWVPPEGCGEG